MSSTHEPETVVKYQFQADDDDWRKWKRTVPRDKSLEKRINELIEADTEGRVVDDDSIETAQRALDDLEAACERGEGDAVREALQRARDALGDE